MAARVILVLAAAFLVASLSIWVLPSRYQLRVAARGSDALADSQIGKLVLSLNETVSRITKENEDMNEMVSRITKENEYIKARNSDIVLSLNETVSRITKENEYIKAKNSDLVEELSILSDAIHLSGETSLGATGGNNTDAAAADGGRPSSPPHAKSATVSSRRLSADGQYYLSRRAIYVRWGSLQCPMGSRRLYSGFAANGAHNHRGSGFNYLCMHPNPQKPQGFHTGDQNGALLYGVEYQNTGHIDLNHDKDAACAVCQWQNGGGVYVEWGNGESRDNPSTPKQCSNTDHEMIYTGLVMSTHYGHWKAESVCVDVERGVHAASSDTNNNGGLFYTTELQQGSAHIGEGYANNREVGCTLCGLPARNTGLSGGQESSPAQEANVFTVWGKRSCPSGASLIYEGFMAGSHHSHKGGGANFLCMALVGSPPTGYSDGDENGNLLYGTEYQNTGAIDANHDEDAACAVCQYTAPLQQVYTQWGRSQQCSNGHATLYQGLVMGNAYTQFKNNHVCVHTDREAHTSSNSGDHNGALLYTTEMRQGSADEAAYPHLREVGCTACVAPEGQSTFTRWGSRVCPSGTSSLYEGFMASSHHAHNGGGANTLCMHTDGQPPAGYSDGNNNGNLMYGMEYQNTGAIDANHDGDAACVVCILNHWEEPYTQWGRSDTCSNGHQTLYSGFIMSNHYTHRKGEFVCVDGARQTHQHSSNADHNGGLLYTTEMQGGASNEDWYPSNEEVGCTVCVAEKEEDELPFAAQEGNMILGQWMKIRSLTAGQDVTVSYGYEQAEGTATTTEETRESAIARAWDVQMCNSVTFEQEWGHNNGFTSASFSAAFSSETCNGYGETETESVAKSTADAASWDVSESQSMSDTFYIPDTPPAGVPQASLIMTYGVHLWQWQWAIVEGSSDFTHERAYISKVQSHYLMSPQDPADGDPKRPCCQPGQEWGSLWYPFRCKTEAGLLPGAENAGHCRVGAPGNSQAQSWTKQEVQDWLAELGLSKDYSSEVTAKEMDGPAIVTLANIVGKASVASGTDNSATTFYLVSDAFGIGGQAGLGRAGDAFKIMNALPDLLDM